MTQLESYKRPMDIIENRDILKEYGIVLTPEQVENNASKTVVVGMSGGVDSSVVALLVKLQGYNTIGVFMKNWEEKDENGQCTSEKDYQDVIRVCEQIDIPYYSLNFVEEYRENVFKEFVEEYAKGNTPNPDILCNREIKFKAFFEKSMELGADYLATGHYCQIGDDHELLKGHDNNKDQSYFLYAINGSLLDKVLFPIGHLEKLKVREIAHHYGLATKAKKDSTGICFIGERNFKEFISQYITGLKGDFVNLESNVVIQAHDGACFYTIGQRKGLGVGGPGGPWFVAKKDHESNQVYLVEGEKHPALFCDELYADEVTWINERPESWPLKCSAKVRYRQQDQTCTISKVDGGLRVVFDTPQRAIAKSQSVVFYNGNECLGGAIIKKVGPSYFDQNKDLPVS